jgi:DNA repair protein RecO (recombination protein O)
LNERTHKTKGIVLRTVKYGETSLVVSMYTELFGMQSYMCKGVRKASGKGNSKSNYFQPGSILQLVVYHNTQKDLQFIKEFDWAYLYEEVFFDVAKNSVALYMVEILQHSLKQPEANPDLFNLIEDSLKHLDKCSDTSTANMPLHFTLQLAAALGFQMQGAYETQTPYIDLQEGNFCKHPPAHFHFLEGELAEITSNIINIHFYEDLANIKLNRETRRQLLNAFQTYFALHVHAFGQLKTVPVLQEIF